MFRSILKRGILLGAAGLSGTSTIYSQDTEDVLKTLKILRHLPKYQESKSLEASTPTLVYLYDLTALEQLDPKLEKTFEKAYKFGYVINKKFVQSEDDVSLIKQRLNINEDELDLRLKHKANYVFLTGDKVYKAPLGIQVKDIDSWVAKCQHPFIEVNSIGRFHDFCRKTILDDEDYIIISNKLNNESHNVLETFSRMKYKLPVIKLDEKVSEALNIPPGITIARPYSKYDGDFDVETQGKLKFISLNLPDFTLEELNNWVKDNNSPVISYCDSYKKIYPMFNKVYNGSLKVLYVMTSQLNPYSQKYDDMLRQLLSIHKKHGSKLPIVIIPNDEIGRKVGVLRNKNLARYKIPEIRYLDFGKLIGTELVNNEFPIIDCSENKSKCGDLFETHYTRKHSFDKKITEESLNEFVEECFKGDFKQYYEKDTTPSTAVRKLCAINFVKEVIESDKDVIVEFYGKYCPGCIRFKSVYNDIAEDLKKKYDNLVVAKVCIDHNMIPQITDKKPYTPIFWLYKKGNKDHPIQFTGKNNKESLINFVKENLTLG
jgi:thiol-disulfide isomerase/thioredoxin